MIKPKNLSNFQELYRIKLAHRLLSRRESENNISINSEHSYSTEKELLSVLPLMPLAAAMIDNIEGTFHRMSDFRKHLINRIDDEELVIDFSSNLPSPFDLALTPGCLNIHILSSSWPNVLSNYSYESLKIPIFLSTIANEFEEFIYGQKNKSLNMSTKYDADGKYGIGEKIRWCHGSSSVTLTYRTQNASSGISPSLQIIVSIIIIVTIIF